MIAAGLFRDAVAQVRDAVGFDHAGAFGLVPTILEVGEQADAVSEQDRDEVELDLVEQASREVLPGDIGGADGKPVFVGA